jgi:hypothetical protein
VSATATASRRPAAGPQPLAALVFGLLVVACFGAFFLTQHLKHTPTAVQEVRLGASFAPTATAGGPSEAVSFRIANNDAVTVTVVDASDNAVATLVADHPQHRYRHLYLHWNGHRGPCAAPTAATCASTESGPLVAPGSYRLRITLVHEGRSVYSPNSFRLLAAGARS